MGNINRFHQVLTNKMNEQQQQKENFFKFNVDVQMIREYMAIITMMIKPVDYQFLLKKTVFKPDDHNNDVRVCVCVCVFV